LVLETAKKLGQSHLMLPPGQFVLQVTGFTFSSHPLR
jgi:hypothetical protein